MLQFGSIYGKSVLKSLLPGGDDVEILIVDDGSHDRTARLQDAYEKKYPGIIRAIHQENGGHGEAVNAGIRNATGLYFKVVDSDDWVKEESLHRILQTLRNLEEEGKEVDMLIANYVYEKEGAAHKKVIHYRNVCRRMRFSAGRYRAFSYGSVYSDAFCDLPYRYAEAMPAESAEAYVLCR